MRRAHFKVGANGSQRRSLAAAGALSRARRAPRFAMGETDTVRSLPEVIARYVAAYNHKDVPGMLACLTDDVVFRNRAQGKLTAETAGRHAFGELARSGAAAFESRHQAVIRAISVEDTTIAWIAFAGTASLSPPPGLRSGERVSVTGASLFRLEGGLIRTIVDES